MNALAATTPATSAWIPTATTARPPVSRDGFQSSVPTGLMSRSDLQVLRASVTTRREPTSADIEGPYYRPNAPFANELCSVDEPGQPVLVSGKVLDTSGQPIAGALVDVWQADKDGAYDISTPDDRTNPDIPYEFRARMKTDENGEFQYRSIQPGNYEIGDGRWRPGHIHYKVSAPGKEPLTTQIYFENDPHNAADPWFDPKRVMPMTDGPGGAKTGRFDFVLASR